MGSLLSPFNRKKANGEGEIQLSGNQNETWLPQAESFIFPQEECGISVQELVITRAIV